MFDTGASYLIPISDGPEGVRQTVRIMSQLVHQYKMSTEVEAAAQDAVSYVPSKHRRAEAEAMFFWVRNNIRYTRDINGVEKLSTPERLLRIRQGDCDDMALLLASMLESQEFETRFIAVGERIGELTHVFVEVKLGKQWIALDPTEPNDPGWRPENMPSVYVVMN